MASEGIVIDIYTAWVVHGCRVTALCECQFSKEHIAYTDVKEVVDRISDVVADVTGYSPVKLADLVIMLVKDLLRRWRKRGLLF
jgi:hypothetical protein